MTSDQKQQLYQALIDFLHQIQTGVNWTIQQAPDVIRQWITYSLVMDWLGVIFGLLGITLFICLFFYCLFTYRNKSKAVLKASEKKGNPYYEKRYESEGWQVACGVSGFAAALSTLFGSALVIGRFIDLMQIYIAPKVWILTNIANLVQHHSNLGISKMKRLLLIMALLLSAFAFTSAMAYGAPTWVHLGKYTWSDHTADVYYDSAHINIDIPNHMSGTLVREDYNDGSIHYWVMVIACRTNVIESFDANFASDGTLNMVENGSGFYNIFPNTNDSALEAIICVGV